MFTSPQSIGNCPLCRICTYLPLCNRYESSVSIKIQVSPPLPPHIHPTPSTPFSSDGAFVAFSRRLRTNGHCASEFNLPLRDSHAVDVFCCSTYICLIVPPRIAAISHEVTANRAAQPRASVHRSEPVSGQYSVQYPDFSVELNFGSLPPITSA